MQPTFNKSQLGQGEQLLRQRQKLLASQAPAKQKASHSQAALKDNLSQRTTLALRASQVGLHFR
jgi:hypothetical protein